MVSFLTEELSYVRLECESLSVDVDEMTPLVQRMEEDIGKSLFNVSTEVQKTYDDMAEAVKRRF